jgi:hypothetical protein
VTLVDKAMDLDHTGRIYDSYCEMHVHPVPLSHAQDAANPAMFLHQ